MVVGICAITLHLPESHSLKDKRQIVKSLVAKVRHQFEVSIAEVEDQDLWQVAKLGMSYVSNSSQHAEEVLAHARRYIEETRPDLLVTDVDVEIMHW